MSCLFFVIVVEEGERVFIGFFWLLFVLFWVLGYFLFLFLCFIFVMFVRVCAFVFCLFFTELSQERKKKKYNKKPLCYRPAFHAI